MPEIGTFDASDLAITLAYAKKDFSPDLMPRLDGGFAVKFIRSAIDDKTAFAVAVDAGAIYRATEKINLSLAVQNLGTKMKFVDGSALPLNLRAGALYRSRRSLSGVRINQYLQDEKFPSAGAEYWFGTPRPARLQIRLTPQTWVRR